MTLSVVIACFNEEKTIESLLERVDVAALGEWQREIIVVDDGSTDTTAEIVRGLMARLSSPIRLLQNDRNEGKGFAVRQGLAVAQGEVVVIQDADLEYDPHDLYSLLKHFASPTVSAVYGSRRLLPHSPISGWPEYSGAQSLNFLLNILFGSHLTDLFTGYKMFRRNLVRTETLTSRGFEIEVELTVYLLREGHRIYEVPIHYYPRTRAEGKKISWGDGWICLREIIAQRFKK